MGDLRKEELERWARVQSDALGYRPGEATELVPVSDDASFRRYFRFSSRFNSRSSSGEDTQRARGLIAVDAPPAHEDNASFARVSGALLEGGLSCPEVLAADFDRGFMLVTDLGNTSYYEVIQADPAQIDRLYADATDSLVKMQSVQCELPAYDVGRLQEELALFPAWFITRQLRLALTAESRALLAEVGDLLVASALAQPCVFVHRDYHCRNLMVLPDNSPDISPGILDFQDAVTGPVTYDLVSLFKDCYYRFDRSLVLEQVEQFRRRLRGAGQIQGVSRDQFRKWFDLMGLQRHLKCAGIFSRLNLRDGKPGYLADLPLVMSYIVECCDIYPELTRFGDWLRGEVAVAMQSGGYMDKDINKDINKDMDKKCE